MTATASYAAIDLGAASGRVVLGAFDGQRLQLEEVHRFNNGPVAVLERLHWDALRLLEEIKAGLARCAARQQRLDGIGIDTWGVDFGLLSASGELLGAPYHYRDPHTHGMFTEAFQRVPREEIYAQTGIQFMEINTLYQLLSLALRRPALLAAARTLLFMPDLLSYWLTGVARSEYSIASTSQLYQATGAGWASDLIEKLGLPNRIWPEVAAPGTPVGPLLPNVATETGLAPTTVIAPACHDTGSAVAAVPGQGQGWAFISSGTWSLVGAELQAPICNGAARAGNFTNEGGVAGTIRFLKNVAGLWLLQECHRTWAQQGDSPTFEQLTRMAAAAPPLVSLVDPDDPRFATPGDMPRHIQDCCAQTGQRVPQSQAEIVRCILESLALKYRTNVALLERLTGNAVNVIHIVGGGVRNKLLCQLTADATGKPVTAGPAEAAAAGNVMVQALAQGRVASLAEVREVVRQSSEMRRYEPARSVGWDDAAQRLPPEPAGQ
ncbi:MAG: rhamnulokinase [Planctomycetes bacterium]|nr:rhamnulokinase [Planctomycetota bacterium]